MWCKIADLIWVWICFSFSLRNVGELIISSLSSILIFSDFGIFFSFFLFGVLQVDLNIKLLNFSILDCWEVSKDI